VPKYSKLTANKKQITSSIIWLIALNWVNRILGFLTIIVLARLLTPHDFGVMAIVIIAIQLTESLTNIGSEQYFIQKNNATIADLYCAWTSNLIIKFFASLCFAALTPLIAKAFALNHLIPALFTISLLPFINALNNGWIIKLKKDLNYKSFVAISTLAKVIANISAILAALYFKNYWALILGALINAVLYTLFSYLFIKQKAYWGLINWQQQFSFSKWIILKGLVGHIRSKIDVWFASSIQGITGLGGYNFSKDLVLLPNREILSPISEVFFTAIAKEKNKSTAQTLKIRKALTIIYLISLPVAFGWSVIAEPFTQVILGEQWLPYISLISTLGFLVFTFSIGNFISYILTATGHVKALFFYDVFTLLFTLFILFFAYANTYINTINELAQIRIYIGLAIVLIGIKWLNYYKILTITEIIKPFAFPLIASILMILNVQIVMNIPNNIFLLISIIVVSLCTYVALIVIGCKYNALGKLESQFINQLINDGVNILKNKLTKHTRDYS